jgi:hypothetical protein
MEKFGGGKEELRDGQHRERRPGGVQLKGNDYRKGNDYCLVAAIDYRRQILFITWVGTHGEFDRIDARTVNYGD